MSEEFEEAVDAAKACASQYQTKTVVVRSDVLHEHNYRWDWIAEPMRSTAYPDNLEQYWRIVAVVHPNGCVEVESDVDSIGGDE